MSFRRLRHALPLALLASAALAASATGQAETIRVAGLERPVEIVIDEWGIPHIYADTERDLFFAQGYNAARDRLFQLELWRRQTTGTLSEVLGPRTLKKDIGARLLRYRGDMQQEMTHYSPRGPAIFQAFVDGVNAYVERTRTEPELLPFEFQLLGIRPERWTVDVVANRLNGLFRNVTSEVQYAQMLQVMDEQTLRDVVDFYPADPELSAHGVDLSLIDDEVVELYRAARAPVEFTAADLAAAHGGGAAEAAVRRLAAWTQPEPDWLRELGVGSNNWVVSGELSASGAPLFANDPHRSISIPPLRYVVHLVGPGWDVIGAGEPTVPGVSMGHNQYGAFGLTIHGLDMEDLYVYETNPANPDEYRYQGGWERMRVIEETIPVEGQRPVTVELKYTRHGPVLHEDPDRNRAYALRAAWLEPGTAPYLASLRYGQASNWEEFRDGAAHHLGPAHNIVWADVHGDIGWQVAGIAPLRDGWSGLLPVPGDGRYEWDGYLPVRELPHERNPAKGFIATANEHNVPAGYPHVFSYEFSEPFRSMRIHEILGASRELTLEDMKRIQLDELSIPARTLVPLLRRVEPQGEAAREARQRLLDWDYVLDRESVPAGIYIAWERRLEENLRDLVVPPAAREMVRSLPTLRVVEWLHEPDARLGAEPVAARDALLRLSLDQAVEELRERLGPDMNQWQYGQPRFKHVTVRHALSDLVDPALRERLDVGPVPRGGTGYTVNPTGGGDNQTHGPSYRIVADASDWDAAVGITTPGQSGDPTSPHYADLFEVWTEGEYIPLTYSRDRVRSAGERVLQLVPAS